MASTVKVFRDHWAATEGPNKLRRRVNDTRLSLHPTWGRREEASANGLVLVSVEEDLFGLEESSELYLEMWGGHPGTARKRFTVNGRGTYAVPDPRVERGDCGYSYPVLRLATRDLVRGTNALQFACDRGRSFWGHFIIDNACLRTYLAPGNPERAAGAPLEQLRVVANRPGDAEALDLSLEAPVAAALPAESIESVDYRGSYSWYDDTGLGGSLHGYTHDRELRGHLGSATEPPYRVRFDTSMVPDQREIRVEALIRLRSGLVVQSRPTAAPLPARRVSVRLHGCSKAPRPFWSRDGELRLAAIELPRRGRVERAELLVRIWDGGAGSVAEPFTLNGEAYDVLSGTARHDLVFSRIEVRPEALRRGRNEIRVLSDTEHHGIEVLSPGPALVVRSSREGS